MAGAIRAPIARAVGDEARGDERELRRQVFRQERGREVRSEGLHEIASPTGKDTAARSTCHRRVLPS